jgi:hypothetical protein
MIATSYDMINKKAFECQLPPRTGCWRFINIWRVQVEVTMASIVINRSTTRVTPT